jgi:hypothetical protein
MPSKKSPDHDLVRAAKRADSHSSELVAGLAGAWAAAFHERRLEDMLGCSTDAVTHLSLCLRPRSDTWSADIAEIAEATTIELGLLESFFRQAEVAERLSMAHPTDGAVDSRLLAARDREEGQ